MLPRSCDDMAPWSDKRARDARHDHGRERRRADRAGHEPEQSRTPPTSRTRPRRSSSAWASRRCSRTTCSQPPRPRPQSPRRTTRAARQALFDLYGQQIIPAAPRRPSGEGEHRPPHRTVQRPGLVRARHGRADGRPEGHRRADQAARALRGRQRPHRQDLRLRHGDDAVAQLRPGGRPRGHVRSRWQRPSDPIHPDVPAGRREPAARKSAQDAGAAPTSNVTVNFNALTANPQQARQAADVIVGGIGYQGGRPASSTKTGA